MLTLFYSPGACSLAPHIVLEELGLEFERRPVLIAEGQHLSREYLKINPRGRVPTLIADGTVITEVPAILPYLASLKRDAGLLPPDGSLDLAKTHEFAGWLSSTLHIAYAQLWRPERFLPEDVPVRLSADGRRNGKVSNLIFTADPDQRRSSSSRVQASDAAG
jgi:glutathione S-transferase